MVLYTGRQAGTGLRLRGGGKQHKAGRGAASPAADNRCRAERHAVTLAEILVAVTKHLPALRCRPPQRQWGVGLADPHGPAAAPHARSPAARSRACLLVASSVTALAFHPARIRAPHTRPSRAAPGPLPPARGCWQLTRQPPSRPPWPSSGGRRPGARSCAPAAACRRQWPGSGSAPCRRLPGHTHTHTNAMQQTGTDASGGGWGGVPTCVLRWCGAFKGGRAKGEA